MLWTDIINPADLTGYARESLAAFEARKGTLARWLPNREVPDTVVRFVKGQTGLVEVAQFRAYDAEPAVGKRPKGERVTLELPAVSQNIPVSEYDQLRMRQENVPDAQALVAIQNTTDLVVQAVSDAMERLRGIVIATGKATIDQGESFQSDDDFGRPASHQLVAASLWTTPAVDRLTYLETITDVYRDTTGEEPGAMLMSTRVFRALAAGDQFQTQLLNGGARNATAEQVNTTISGAGLPPIFIYDRRVRVGGVNVKAFPDHLLALLPAPVETDDWAGTDLGATFWGRTLTSSDSTYAIEDADQPGIVAGVYRNPKPPMTAEVIGDAIGEPVLANADKSLVAEVLAAS